MKRHPCDLYLSNVAREVLGDGVAEQVAREVLTLAEHQGWDQSCCYIKHFGDVLFNIALQRDGEIIKVMIVSEGELETDRELKVLKNALGERRELRDGNYRLEQIKRYVNREPSDN